VKLLAAAGIYLLAIMKCAYAIEYEWPIVSGVDVTLTSSNSATYIVHFEKTTINDPTIAKTTTVLQAARAHGMPEIQTYSYVIYHRHNNDSHPDDPIASYVQVSSASTGVNFANFAADITSRTAGTTRTHYHSGSSNGSECVGATLTAGGQGNSYYTWLSRTWNGGVQGGCIGTPPVNQWCALTTPVLNVSYGTLTVGEAEGFTRVASVQVECTTGMKYTLRLPTGDQRIALNNGGTASIAADGHALGETLEGQAGENEVNLAVTLHGPFERTGAFEGSGVLFVSYP